MLPRRQVARVAARGRAPAPARKQASSITESPGAGGKTYSSHARGATSASPAHWCRTRAWWMDSITAYAGSVPVDEVAEERDGPALAAQRLDHAHERERHVEEHQVEEPEGEKPREHPCDRRQDGADEDQREEDDAGDAAQYQPLLGVPAHVFAPRDHEGNEGQDPQVREDEHDLVFLVQVLGANGTLVGGEGFVVHCEEAARDDAARRAVYNGRPRPCQGDPWTA